MKTKSITTVEVDNAMQSISQAKEEARHILAQEALDAKKVIESATAEALKINNTKSSADHDLLIRVDTKLDQLSLDVAALTDGTAKRIALLESTKLDIKDSYVAICKETVDRRLATHGGDIESLKTARTTQTVMLSLGIALLVILFGLLTYHLFGVKL